MSQRYVVVDLETTGNSVKKGDRIIQFAAVIIENDKIVEEFSTFLNPEQSISPFIEELTGIHESMLVNAPLFSEVAPKIIELLQDSCFVAHNVLFDLSFLQDELYTCGYEGFYGSTIDTVELAKIMRPTATSYKLSHLAKEEGYEHDRPHQADSDAYATAELFLKFAKELHDIPLVTLKQLYKLSYSLKSEISELISLILQKRMSKSPIHHPHLFINKGIALKKSMDSDEEEIRKADFEFPETKEKKIEQLQKAFSNLEIRNDQMTMMDEVYRVFNANKIALIEAGTGLGKTLGYLLPAAYYAIQNNEKVMISTYTIELQNQLLQKELAKLQLMVPFKIHTVVLKGRANYLSLAKFDRALRTRDDNYDSALTKMQILIWLLHTETGDKDELNLSSGGELFWDRLQGANNIATEHQNSWEPFDFYQRAKALAYKADLIITNHSYLMTDYFLKNNQEASCHTLIIDEAHQLENAASKHLGSTVDYVKLKMMINKLGSFEQNQLIHKVAKMISDIDPSKNQIQFHTERLLQEVTFELEQFFQLLSSCCEEYSKKSHTQNTVTIPMLLSTHTNAKPLMMIVERLSEHFKQLAADLRSNVEFVLQNGQPGKTQLFYLSEMESIASFFVENAQRLMEYFVRNKDSVLYWLEWNRKSPSQYVFLYSQPIMGGSDLWLRYFAFQKSVVLTSSTLTVKGSFDYMKNKLGLHNKDIEVFSFPSPFLYKEKVQMLIPDDIPEVNAVSADTYVDNIAIYIEKTAIASKGRMLVLFTSQEMLRMTHEKLKERSALDDFNILSQGISSKSKSRLIKYFQNFDKSILLGTASFWDGLDLPGETLQSLMIVRLPFSPPDEPLTDARCKRIKENGGNPFSEYSLPEAIMRFRQGFGRLIRTNEDKGIFIVCDRRIVTTKYGIDFIKSIPEIEMKKVNQDIVQSIIKKWLNEV
ncbi:MULTISPECIES: ATP-dependent DNA helicase DinG [Bacillus]|uniref:ATP-dependent DNA helicase DinG n=1 Tax=Bacillus TaxID=1386 RepID=UPI0002ED0B13|nr:MULTISPECIES: ATP-dependent DNA helicase DinG [Bacillus]